MFKRHFPNSFLDLRAINKPLSERFVLFVLRGFYYYLKKKASNDNVAEILSCCLHFKLERAASVIKTEFLESVNLYLS